MTPVMDCKPFLIFPLLLLLLISCNDIDFNSEQWKNWEEKESNMHMRWDMVDDLMNNYDLVGKSILETEQLLGSTEEECDDGNCRIYYSLGPCRSGIDYGSLMIQYKKGKLTHIERHCN